MSARKFFRRRCTEAPNSRRVLSAAAAATFSPAAWNNRASIQDHHLRRPKIAVRGLLMKVTTRFPLSQVIAIALFALSTSFATSVLAAPISATEVGTVIDGMAYGDSASGFVGGDPQVGDGSGLGDQEATVWGKFAISVPSGEYITSALLEFGGFALNVGSNGPGLSATPSTDTSWNSSSIDNDLAIPGESELVELLPEGSYSAAVQDGDVSGWFGLPSSSAYLPATGNFNIAVAIRRANLTNYFDGEGVVVVPEPTFQLTLGFSPVPTPEPSGFALVGLGVAGITALWRRQRRS